MDVQKPKNCVECPFGDHEAWCLVPGDWRKRYYMPTDHISKDCPIWPLVNNKEETKKKPE